MTWRFLAAALLAGCCLALAVRPVVQAASEDDAPAKVEAAKDAPAKETAQPSVRYVPLDAPAGMSQAVVVQGLPLVHTRQLLPLDRDGKLVGKDSVDKQVGQLLDNLDAVLKDSGSSLGQLVRLNVYALAPATIDHVREKLAGRLPPDVRPAITSVLTPMPHRDALVAVDAVATAAEQGDTVALKRCEAVAGDKDCADAAVLPRGGVAYLSGMSAEAGLTESAVDTSIAGLWKMLGELKLSPEQVVRLKVFLRPALAADDVRRKLKEHFPGRMVPPVVFVEWLAEPPVEIELVAQLPLTGESTPKVEYYNPPEVRPSQLFSRAALVRSERQIYISSLFSPQPTGHREEEAVAVFDQLEAILARAGSDLRHMAKGTYYTIDAGSASGMDRLRLWRYDQACAPAASKCMVHGVGQSGRTLTMDMIAVGSEQ
jgi:enamine deaminase RidA (YjgF/YER057c/UK114 family)